MSELRTHRTLVTALLLATILPSALAALSPVGVAGALYAAIGLVAGTHIAGTAYLVSDPLVRDLARRERGRLVLIPLALTIAAFALICSSGHNAWRLTLYVSFLWSTWHVGVQGVGITSLVSLAERGRPLTAWERRTIKVASACGVLGVLGTVAPGFGVTSQLLGDISGLELEAFRLARLVGSVLAVSVAVYAGRFVTGAHGAPRTAIVGVASALLPLLLYLPNPTQGFATFAATHGLQYVVVLAAHASGRGSGAARGSVRVSMLALLVTLIAGRVLWSWLPEIRTARLDYLGAGILVAVGFAHYWVDAIVWRLGDPTLGAHARERLSIGRRDSVLALGAAS